MMSKAGLLYLLGTAVLAILVLACNRSGPSAAATPSGVVPTPQEKASVSAGAQVTLTGSPTPTPVPAKERQVALEFALAHRAITQEWERFHADTDEWRQGLIACDASSVSSTLKRFAGRFISITESARGLVRDPIVRELADKSIAAAQREEEAIRLLRDSWQPGDPAVFETVEIERAAASALRQQVVDGLNDLLRRTASESRALVEASVLSVQGLDRAWDEFHRHYDAFRTERGGLTSAETVQRLGELIDEFRSIVVTVRDLPPSEVTRPVAQTLSEAAEDEDLALRKLRGTFERSGEATLGAGAGQTDSQDSGGPGQEEAPISGSGETAPSLFDTFDEQLVRSNALRRQALEELADISDETSEESRAVAGEFSRQFGLLVRSWGEFHRDYDEWLATEGGCDRQEVIGTLDRFVIRFAKLAKGVREAPRATFLRPLGELFVEAAEREEEALRALRNTWRPFDAELFSVLEQERNEARRLRRQVAAGVQDLLERYGISSQELDTGSSSGR